ncbi:hemopexin repeat-containing protein [Pseudoalteromonas luteoviolacea]|uniref:Tc toxin subunit A-related protein n=1 Tax=Pseudoalteromonas luteoviolacea TaxID=43657 RepID=UPI001F35B2C2|nr:hemopexin repeat-containing protein [Pseudoalteromonas luteoviolacea]MCF6442145.1 hemopexin repeat-containing protein [Pseudoalteromonas luteoviolacea]
MTIKNDFPDYSGLFGGVNFKTGDDARSVYSPAAYLTDLLQILDDEFVDDGSAKSVDLDQRRKDIKSILLDDKNTNTLIPYLEIVNEVLESKIPGDAYQAMKGANYPFNMPFSLDNEKIKNSLKHLGISYGELYKLFATTRDYHQVAQDYLGLSPEEYVTLIENDSPASLEHIKACFGYNGDDFIHHMSKLENLLDSTELAAPSVREVLYQLLYIDPENHVLVESGRKGFYINQNLQDAGLVYHSGYATLSEDETTLHWYSLIDSQHHALPVQWFERFNRFVRLAQKSNITFTELDRILTTCCRINNTATLNKETLTRISQVVQLHKVNEQPIDTVLAIISAINYQGQGNEALPNDQFNQIFNHPCIEVDNRYIHISDVMGSIPAQYTDTTYNEYTLLEYHTDLFSEENAEYRKRLYHTLNFSETDLVNITQYLEYKGAVESSLWNKVDKEWELLNTLYRVHALSNCLDVHFLELFKMFELLERDPFIGRYDPHDYFIYQMPSTQKCFDIFVSDDINNRLWLVESLCVLKKWMSELGYSTDLLWQIVNNSPLNDSEKDAQKAIDLNLFNTLLQTIESLKLTPDVLELALNDTRAARFSYELITTNKNTHCDLDEHMNGVSNSHKKLLKQQLIEYTPNASEDLANAFIQQLEQITNREFMGLPLYEKLLEKVYRNLINHQVIDGNGAILISGKDTDDIIDEDDFSLEYDFSHYSDQLYALLHEVYQEQAQNNPDEVEIQIFVSDLRKLDLTTAEAKELYDNLIFNGYIDEEGHVRNASLFSQTQSEAPIILQAGLNELSAYIYEHITTQVNKFKACQIHISEQIFSHISLKPVALQDLMTNLQVNGYIDSEQQLIDPLRLIDATAETLNLDLQFYPYRQKIYEALQEAIAQHKEAFLSVERAYLSEVSAKTVSRWIHEDLQQNYLHGDHIRLRAIASSFFLAPENKSDFNLRHYFDETSTEIIFEHIAGIVEYADKYRLSEQPLVTLGFSDAEIEGVKIALQNMDVLTSSGMLTPEQFSFFLVAENAANFSVAGFEDFDKEIFFLLYEIANNIENTLIAIDSALEQQRDNQESSVLAILKNVLGIDEPALKNLTQAFFQTDENLHIAWLRPLIESADALNTMHDLPKDKHYCQTVSRIRQLALLIKKLQLTAEEIDLFLKDQSILTKFPEALKLPEGITSIDAVLESEDFLYLFKNDEFWLYQSHDHSMIDKKNLQAGISDYDDELIEKQQDNEALQKRLKEDPIRQLFAKENISQVDASFIDSQGTWCVISGEYHYVKYADSDTWDKRDNRFGEVESEFDNLEWIDSTYVDTQGKLYIFSKDKYVRYSNTQAQQLVMDPGYPKHIAQHWNDENQPIQLPGSLIQHLGPLIDGTDRMSYAFSGNQFVSSEDGQLHHVSEKWGHKEHNFGPLRNIDAAMTMDGDYMLFSGNKVVKYSGSIELANLQPDTGYPKALYQEFDALPNKFGDGIDAALQGVDARTYLFHDNEFVTIEGSTTSPIAKTAQQWGKVANEIETSGIIDAALVGLDGRTYLFSGDLYVRYSGEAYDEVDDGFPRNIAQDWEGLTQVTAAFVLGNKTYLFGRNEDNQPTYVRYSTIHLEEDDFLKADQRDPHARNLETVLKYRADVDEIEVFPAAMDDKFWSLPASVTQGEDDFQIDAVMNGPDGKVYLFFGNHYIEHHHANRWWSEPKLLTEKWQHLPQELNKVAAAFSGKDGKTYLFFDNKFIRFSNKSLEKVDNGYPKLTNKYWGKVRNTIQETGQVDATLVVESRWQELNKQGTLTDFVEMHTYLFSGDQIYRYKGSDYSSVEPGYPRSIHRLKDEPRFKGLETEFPNGLDAAFADQRQIYLFKDDSFHVVIGDEESYKKYEHEKLTNIQAITQEKGDVYVLGKEDNARWHKFNHLESSALKTVPALPRMAEKAQTALSDAISTILNTPDGNSYVFAGDKYFDTSLGLSFKTSEVWGRSLNPIYDQDSLDAAFVGRDGVTYVFSGEWFVQYDTSDYTNSTVMYPPRKISDKWHGLKNVALAYVWKDTTYLCEHPDNEGNFRLLRYTDEDYSRPDPGYPQIGGPDFWQIPEAYAQEGFDTLDTIFVLEDNLIFISDQEFIRFNLKHETWSYPQPLSLIYPGIPFNKTDFQDLKSGFVGADGKAYFFNEHSFISCIGDAWTQPKNIKDYWGKQTNIFENGVDASYVASDGTSYLFAGNQYVRYSISLDMPNDYRYVDEGYPKHIATYLHEEPAFSALPKMFQQHLDTLEANNESHYFSGFCDTGRSLYVFSQDSLHTWSENKYEVYSIEGLGQVENNFTQGGVVDAAFVNKDDKLTYLFSGEQYIRYSGDEYRFIDEGYPKLIAQDLASELGVNDLPEYFNDGIDAACYLPDQALFLSKDRQYLAVYAGNTSSGDIKNLIGKMENAFTLDPKIDGAYTDAQGALYVFKGTQCIRYSDTQKLLSLNRYNDACYTDTGFPQNINEHWSRLDDEILPSSGIDSVFKLNDQVYFHTAQSFVTYEADLSDKDEIKPSQVLAYRFGTWSDYLLSDIQAISQFKALNERYTGGELSLTELVTGINGQVKEPYMQFAAIFGFEKEQVRWLKQHNAFLPGPNNALETKFDIEQVLRLYHILATTQRLNVEVIPLYKNLWQNLYGAMRNDANAALAAKNLLLQVGCDNNYQVLAKQINRELNALKRDALVPYVISQDTSIDNTRDLYQKLLIDIQMDSSAETSRVKEATAALQLYMHRFFVNLEDLQLDAVDQHTAREDLKERWEWLKSYRVWEANRKVFLYPENYLRPELRDTISPAFKGLQESLTQGELTEELVKDAYIKYLDASTEACQLNIAGGYVYDDQQSNDKNLALFGRTRTAPYRYSYRFASLVNGSSRAIKWQPWQELDIQIPSENVEPIYAFNRLFVFWTELEETIPNAASGSVNISESGSTFSASSGNNVQYRINVYYSFYNLNKTWSRPQLLNTSGYLYRSFRIYQNQIKLFVKTLVNHEGLTEIRATVRCKNLGSYYHSGHGHYHYHYYYYDAYPSFSLTSELTSRYVGNWPVGNPGQSVFRKLFPNEGNISENNAIMLSGQDSSVDSPWFAYNHHKGSSFLVKPDVVSLPDNVWPTAITHSNMPTSATITAAFQVADNSDVYFFLADKTYQVLSENGTQLSDAKPINSRWGMQFLTEMQTTKAVDSAFVMDKDIYLTLHEKLYRYDDNAIAFLAEEPQPLNTLIADIPANWHNVDAGFSRNGEVFWFNNEAGDVLSRTGGNIPRSIRSQFALPSQSNGGIIDRLDHAVVYKDVVHIIRDNVYETYSNDGASEVSSEATMQKIANSLTGTTVTGLQGANETVTGMMVLNEGVWLRSDNHSNIVDGPASYISTVNDVDLVGYWPLAGNANDYHENSSSNNGTNQGGANWISVTDCPISNGDPMYVLDLDGESGYINIPYSSELQSLETVTVELWAKLTPLESRQMLVSNSNLSLQVTDEGNMYFVYGGTTISRTDANGIDVNDNAWHHLAVVYDSSGNVRHYIDGNLEYSANYGSYSLQPFTYPLTIGMENVYDRFYTKGQIAEVRIWKSARTQQQIQANINRSLLSQEASYPLPFSEATKEWKSGLSYNDSSKTTTIAFYEGGIARAWIDNTPVTFGGNGTFEHGLNVTSSFVSSNGKNLIVVTDSEIYHIFDHIQSPDEVLIQLKEGSNQGKLEHLQKKVYLGDVMQQNPIWANNSVDAAFIGTESLGEKDALYLFSGNKYCRYSPNNEGQFAPYADNGYPKGIVNNIEGFPANWQQVDAAFTATDGTSYLFNNATKRYYRSDTAQIEAIDRWGTYLSTDLMREQHVKAAFCNDKYLYLLTDKEYYRYTLTAEKQIPDVIDSDYPKLLPELATEDPSDNDEPASTNMAEPADDESATGHVSVDAIFSLNGSTYALQGTQYQKLALVDSALELDNLKQEDFQPLTGTWGNIPTDIRQHGLSAAFNASYAGSKVLTFIQNENYIEYRLESDSALPYVNTDVKYELIRLSSSTAEQLNQVLFSSGVEGLLKMSTQEKDESPTISFAPSSGRNIQMNVSQFSIEPVNSHLDFNSANGLYYWETFFHAPFLIAQTLNANQKFEQAKQWFEYIFDPTEPGDYWKFLPFLAADPDAIMASLLNDLEQLALISGLNVSHILTYQQSLASRLAPYQAVFLGLKDKALFESELTDDQKLANLTQWQEYSQLKNAIDGLTLPSQPSTKEKETFKRHLDGFKEGLALVAKLDRRIDLMSNYTAQLATYLDDPFDPHAIASLRPLAYRKAIVMRYIDNLLDWGDMLFRQYTRESINEARMLYILAYDLLGEKPQNMGKVVLEAPKAYKDFKHYSGNMQENYDFLIDMENLGTVANYEPSLSFAATQFDTITRPYFFLKENDLFTEYWQRVEDRLYKIRSNLNIDGVAQPLPLFQPPIDPMALVNAVAGGGSVASAVAAAGGAGTVPDYRFDVMLSKAREITSKLAGFSDALMSALEKKDAEALSILQGKQESAMLNVAKQAKQYQIKESEISLDNLQASLKRAKEQLKHYDELINDGYLDEEKQQLRLMNAATGLTSAVALGHLASGVSYMLPQVTVGAFSFGATSGGTNWGAVAGKFSEALQSTSEAVSTAGEVVGIKAQFERTKQDWVLQQKMSKYEIEQLRHEIRAQKERIKASQHELVLHDQEVEHKNAINTFMQEKYSNEQLYSWMSGKLSGLLFQTYKMAHDYAKQAEQAFIYEKGLKAGEVNYINGMYWDSSQKGMFCGQSLELDLDRMDKAYMENNGRRLEITKSISLLELNPLALLDLQSKGECTFRLSEELFDYDFPGHYNRQLKTISVTFELPQGQKVNATLTQLNSKLVMAPDIKAVKHLMDPSNEATTNVRENWRANQQVALSHVDEYTENNGLFELNFHDERYLPFEGTGAVSNWRLALNGHKGSYNPDDLVNVIIKARYTAEQGGQRFANEVKGLLKPYHANTVFDMANHFPHAWLGLTQGGETEVQIQLTQDMFPNMSSSKVIGMLVRYQYAEQSQGAVLNINDALQLNNVTYIQPSNLNIDKAGSQWTLSLKGDPTGLQNAEMVVVYKAKV